MVQTYGSQDIVWKACRRRARGKRGKDMKIAINGAGVAGPALAYWLHRNGDVPVLIEKAPSLRTGGYVIDFWGLGYTVAERMGLLPEVLKAGYKFHELRFVDDQGRREGGFCVDVFQKTTQGRLTSLPRGDLASIIYKSVEGKVETLFGNSIQAIDEHEDGVNVTLEDGAKREFDLVVGADGLHSRVRNLVFGPEEKFRKDLGYRVATFMVDGYRPRDEGLYVIHGAPGRQCARLALRNDHTAFLLVFRADLMQGAEPASAAETRTLLRDVFGGMGWECPKILDAMWETGDIYFDSISQIRMPAWSKGRTILIGDAAAAVSLLAGEGTGLALAQAYILAGELECAEGNHLQAFRAYERSLRSFLKGKQKAAEGFASSVVPETRFGVWFRNQATKIMRLPKMTEMLMGGTMRDDFDLPDYGNAAEATAPAAPAGR
jgi:2-polyprenyl-6-methoxyphenol hydroxylase-like FAD-dependent oxidoreductase